MLIILKSYPVGAGGGGFLVAALATLTGTKIGQLTGRLMTHFNCTTAELATPEFLRLLALATIKENQRLEKKRLARFALSICNKLRPGATKARHNSRILRALNSLRAAA